MASRSSPARTVRTVRMNRARAAMIAVRARSRTDVAAAAVLLVPTAALPMVAPRKAAAGACIPAPVVARVVRAVSANGR